MKYGSWLARVSSSFASSFSVFVCVCAHCVFSRAHEPHYSCRCYLIFNKRIHSILEEKKWIWWTRQLTRHCSHLFPLCFLHIFCIHTHMLITSVWLTGNGPQRNGNFNRCCSRIYFMCGASLPPNIKSISSFTFPFATHPHTHMHIAKETFDNLYGKCCCRFALSLVRSPLPHSPACMARTSTRFDSLQAMGR